MRLINPLVWLAGGDPEVLAECPGQARRMAAYGGAILFTGALAGAAAAFAMRSWFHLHGPWLAVCGTAWGLGIMNLDRVLFMALSRQPYRLATVALATPRILLALLVGRVVAEPVIQQLFYAEVTQRAQSDREEEAFAARTALDRQYAVIDRLTARRDGLRKVLAGQPRDDAILRDPAWRAMQRRVDAAARRYDRLAARASCELDGSCGSDKIGDGPAYRDKRSRAAAAKRELAALEGRQRTLRTRLLAAAGRTRRQQVAAARRDLKTVRHDLRTQRHRRDVAAGKLNRAANAPIGYLDRTKALSELSAATPAVAARRNLWAWFLTVVDAVPVLVKLFMLLGVRSAYEETEEELRLRRLNATRAATDAADAVSRIDAEATIEDAEIRRTLARDTDREIHERFEEVRREAALASIERWREEMLRDRNGPAPLREVA